ncbi:riboflavin-specific deaminase-like protein [Motilibacter peucedani]|uniref:Riboflavin-specific deaminase-like protein n=1 Tax=Motilibacter peucedani TaxID=598650 RepID=A0A420XS17_9ACTN|nr:pyrimidine reductase family protein [Motilibacter peucedani]RKS77685.1 riboflavin-specific deaminase-like protein [Motilibacter peucedani]
MQRLLPSPAGPLDDDALFEAYAYPVDRPWVRGNMVASVDGAATADGRSRGLSSAADRRVFRVLRALADVVLVGAGTVRAEGYAAVLPKETFPERRAAAGQPPTAAIAVVSRALDLDLGSALFTGGARTLVVTSEAADPARVAALAEVADVVVAGEHEVDLASAVDQLAERGLERVLCEGGPGLLRDVVAADRLDELCLTVSPQLRAGDAPRVLHGPSLFAGLALTGVLEEDGSLFLRYGRGGA